MLKISDITKFTLQDYPNKLACIIWFGGCNMRCKYCHNVEFLNQNDGFIGENIILDFLRTKVGLLDGVVLSGGECTLNAELADFIVAIKTLGFAVKIDTNGLNFNTVRTLMENGLADFVALDFKAQKNKFTSVTQIDSKLYENFENTLKLVVRNFLDGKIEAEIRTTVHTSLLQEDDLNDIIEIIDNLNYNGVFYIQNFRDDGKGTLSNLGKQDYILDKNKIVKPKNFSVVYRNFW
ncbi:anaerobic ribonucleoside-triphosphate reductase activating protein [Bacilli bacterium]|nr:anaerobic ribonucleoside-triphosphate reductase activating protein [Bacilli bacterium]